MAPSTRASARRSERGRDQPIHETDRPPANPVTDQAVHETEIPQGNPVNGQGKARTVTMSMETLQALMESAVSNRIAQLDQEHMSLEAKYVKDFLEYEPKSFDGLGLDPIVAITWISSLESIFGYMKCPEDQKVHCAVFRLRDDAVLWWESSKGSMKDPVTWVEFKDVFFKKYYPSRIRIRKENEFLRLNQGNRTVDEYDREFIRLCYCVPELVGTEAERLERFIMGLRDEIGGLVALLSPPNYRRAVEIAERIDHNRPQKRKFDTVGCTNNVNPMCASCGESCSPGTWLCFCCRREAHMAKADGHGT